MSKRQQIVDKVKERFALIRTTNEYAPGKFYQTDIGERQTEWHPVLKNADPEADELPSHDIRDEVEEAVIENKNAGTYTALLTVTVIAEQRETDATATLSRKALVDMVRAVGVDPTWGGLARRTLPVSDEVSVDEAAQRVGSAALTFQVEYSRRPWEA